MSTLVLLVYFLLHKIAAADHGFIYPPTAGDTGEYISDLGFTVGQNISLIWTVDSHQNIDLWLLQDTAGDGNGCPLSYSRLCNNIAENIPNNGSLPWIVNRMGMTGSDIYYIAAMFNETEGFNTHYFNITKATSTKTITTTSSLPTSTAPSSASDTGRATTSLSVSKSSSSTATGTIVGGVVGGVVLISIIAVLVIMLHKAKKKGRSTDLPRNGLEQESAQRHLSPGENKPYDVYTLKPEMDGTARPYELPS